MAIDIAMLVGLVLCACLTATAIALETRAFLKSPQTNMTAACLRAVMLVFGACASLTSVAIGAVWAMDGAGDDTSHMAGAALIVVGSVSMLGVTIVREMWGGVCVRKATEVASVVVVEPSSGLPNMLSSM